MREKKLKDMEEDLEIKHLSVGFGRREQKEWRAENFQKLKVVSPETNGDPEPIGWVKQDTPGQSQARLQKANRKAI